jgi:hypothetical protein
MVDANIVAAAARMASTKGWLRESIARAMWRNK